MVDCPDLVEFGCAAAGLGGDTKLVEGGGEPFNHDADYNKEVTFHLERMARLAGHGTGSYLQVGTKLKYAVHSTNYIVHSTNYIVHSTKFIVHSTNY